MTKDYHLGYARGLRRALLAALGDECSICGEDDLVVLHVDHIKGGGTQHRRRVGSGPAYYMALLKLVRTKTLRLLCGTCDRREQWRQRRAKGAAATRQRRSTPHRQG